MNLKFVYVALGLALLASGVAAAAPAGGQVSGAQSEYAKAVKSYIDAATDNVRAIRGEVDGPLKDASEETKGRFSKVYVALERCEKLLADLKKAGPVEFDRIKAEFEIARAKVMKELETVKKSIPTPT